MIKYLIPLCVISSAFAEPVEVRIDVSHNKLEHLTMHAKAAGTDKPPVLFFDGTLPYTERNQGMTTDIQAGDLHTENLQTEGPIQISYYDHESKQHTDCGQGIHQEQGSQRLYRINVNMQYSPSGINCVAEGLYKEMTAEQKDDNSSKVAELNSMR